MYIKALLVGMFSGIALLSNAATLQDVKFSSLPGDRTEVRLSFDDEPPTPTGYTIEQPARIVLDLPGTSSSLAQKNFDLGVGASKSMAVVGTKDRTRLVFSLVELTPYEAVVEQNQIVVVLGGAAGGTYDGSRLSTSSSLGATRSSDIKTAVSIEALDFQRGEKGDGQVVITFSSSQVDIDMSEEAGNIRLKMRDVFIPEELRRRLDVTDFATPVTRIDALSEDGGSIVTIKPVGDFDYLAYQTDKQFIVSVEALTDEEVEDRRKDKFPYSGEKLSLNFQDIEVRSVLQLIADFTGLNLVASDTVGGKITLRLQNVPWDQALELILKTKGLDKRQVGNVLLVAPADEIAAREKLELEASKQTAELAPVRLDVIQINYAKSKDIVDLLKQDKELISNRGFISSDARTNTISVRETAEKLEQIRRLIKTWDIPVRQVLIEARIVRARSNVASDMGIQWGGGLLQRSGDELWRVGGSMSTLSELSEVANGNSNSISFPDALAIDLGVSKTNASSLAIGYGKDNFLINMELSALEADGRGEIVSQPKVVTADRQKAIIKSGEEIPYQEASSSGATSVSFKEAVLSLEVIPQITPDNKIIMDLKINQDNRGEVTAGIPSIETNEVETQVLVANGETVVLGGIFQTEQAKTITKTPFLGDIPYLGTLFTKTEEIDERAELLIFITPKLITQGLVDN